MSESQTTDDDGEYRPTDYLAVCEWSYGIGHTEEQAIQAALRFAGPFDPDDDSEPVSVTVWELYADSWESHSPSGPERGAEQLSYTEYEIPREKAARASDVATEANAAYHRALDSAEIVYEEGTPDG